jgi:hypothetical protein
MPNIKTDKVENKNSTSSEQFQNPTKFIETEAIYKPPAL